MNTTNNECRNIKFFAYVQPSRAALAVESGWTQGDTIGYGGSGITAWTWETEPSSNNVFENIDINVPTACTAVYLHSGTQNLDGTVLRNVRVLGKNHVKDALVTEGDTTADVINTIWENNAIDMTKSDLGNVDEFASYFRKDS